MAILSLPGFRADEPFCDALDLTFPADLADDVRSALVPFLVDVRATSVTPDLWEVPRVVPPGFQEVSGKKLRPATVKLSRFGPVFRVSFSGGSCSALRAIGEWDRLLATLWPYPHRITRLDASLDVQVDAAPHVLALAAAARAGGVRLGRKAVKPTDVLSYTGLDARGVLTGTSYVGSSKAEIRLKAYDKRHETEVWTGRDPGPMLRLELTLRDVGATMRDAGSPAAIFWNYASAVLDPPAGAPAWSAGDTGYALPPPQERNYWALLERRVSHWPDLEELRLLALNLGTAGPGLLLRLIARELRVPATVFA